MKMLKKALQVVNRITGNTKGSLGLHPAVYFYNERGKYSRFLFLGMAALITEQLRDNNSGFFKVFTEARKEVEKLLIENKFLIGLALQNMSKRQRVPKMKEMFEFLIQEVSKKNAITPERIIGHMGLRGRILDVNTPQSTPVVSEDTKTMLFIRGAIQSAQRCPECGGLLDTTKSMSYDHKIPVRQGGSGDVENIQLTHPYCNTAKEGLASRVPVGSRAEDIEVPD